MLLNENKYIAQFSLYPSADPNHAQLFLHAHSHYFSAFIQLLQLGANSCLENSQPAIEKRYEILPNFILRLSGSDILLGLTFIIPHLTCEADLRTLREQVAATRLPWPAVAWQPLTPPLPPHRVYTDADHTAEAVKAAQTGDNLVLNILLGDKITSAELSELAEIRRQYGLNAPTLYSNQLMLEVAPRLLLLLDQHRSKPFTEDSNAAFICAFNLCLLYNAEKFIHIKTHNLKVRPLLTGVSDTESSYEQWVRDLVHSTLASHFALPVDFDLANPTLVQTLRARLNLRNTTEISDIDYICSIKQALARLDEKQKEHKKFVQILLSMSARFIPASYQFHNLNERKVVEEALLRVRLPVNTADRDGNTFMHHALKNACYLTVNLLLANGASETAQNNVSENPFQYALVSREAFDRLKQTSTNQLDGTQMPLLKEFYRRVAAYEHGVLIPKENALNGGSGLGAIIRRMLCSQKTVDNRREAVEAFAELLQMACRNFNLNEFITKVEEILGQLKIQKSEKLYEPLAKLVKEYHAHPERYDLVRREATSALRDALYQVSREKDRNTAEFVTELEQKNQEIAVDRARMEEEYRRQIMEKDAQLAAQIAEKDVQVAERNTLVEEKDKLVADQRSEIEQVRHELAETKKMVQENQAIMQRLLLMLGPQINIASMNVSQQNTANPFFSSASPTLFSSTAASAAASSAAALPMPLSVSGGPQ
jgi:hypothetical protein